VPHPSFAVLAKEGGELDFLSNHSKPVPDERQELEA
jgi:hypothetical protein